MTRLDDCDNDSRGGKKSGMSCQFVNVGCLSSSRVRDCQLFLSVLFCVVPVFESDSRERLLMTRRGESSLSRERMGDEESSSLVSFPSSRWMLSCEQREHLSYRQVVGLSLPTLPGKEGSYAAVGENSPWKKAGRMEASLSRRFFTRSPFSLERRPKSLFLLLCGETCSTRKGIGERRKRSVNGAKITSPLLDRNQVCLASHTQPVLCSRRGSFSAVGSLPLTQPLFLPVQYCTRGEERREKSSFQESDGASKSFKA